MELQNYSKSQNKQPSNIEDIDMIQTVFSLFPLLKGKLKYGPICPVCSKNKVIGVEGKDGSFRPFKDQSHNGQISSQDAFLRCSWCQKAVDDAKLNLTIKERYFAIRDYEIKQREEKENKKGKFILRHEKDKTNDIDYQKKWDLKK